MLQGFAALSSGRFAAAILIVTLSGVAALVPDTDPVQHRCLCQLMHVHGHHLCSCPICRLAGLRAAAYDTTASAGDHAVAMKALREELARPENGGLPTCSSQCDPSGGRLGVSASRDVVTLPRLPTLARRETVERADEGVCAPTPRSFPPDLPPPRSVQS